MSLKLFNSKYNVPAFLKLVIFVKFEKKMKVSYNINNKKNVRFDFSKFDFQLVLLFN